ncbi:MAG: PmeII family type II restriction endonuclease [Xanthomarina gelatinilytica]|uniref:PmeII family type II restriction endonuclease n=1 Tax=Xanthomarina gelatinilytica TaxID=1137281 RepID=UPI003A8A0A93
MEDKQRLLLLKKAKSFFRDVIVQVHITVACTKASNLKNYNVNPFLFKYLANFLKGNDSARSIAEALVLPRVLGSSINTSFGMRIQKLISELFEGLVLLLQELTLNLLTPLMEEKNIVS